MSKTTCKGCSKSLCASKVPIFENLNCVDLEEIASEINHKLYLKNEIVFNDGNTANTLFFIDEGKVKLFKYNREGKEQIFHILSDGDFFGELNLLSNTGYKFNAKAIEDTKICTLTKEKFKNIMIKKPEIAFKLLENLGERLAAIENLAQNLATNDIDARTAYLLTNLMDKYSEVIDGIKVIKLPLSREDMANYIGVTRETISRKLKKFENEGIIKIIGTKQIEIVDEEGLNNYL